MRPRPARANRNTTGRYSTANTSVMEHAKEVILMRIPAIAAVATALFLGSIAGMQTISAALAITPRARLPLFLGDAGAGCVGMKRSDTKG
jgi:hypothetical protein